MLHGDISNRQCPIIAFNIDNLLFDKSIKDGILDKFVDKLRSEKQSYLNRGLNEELINHLDYIWNNFNFSVVLVTKYGFVNDIEDKLSEYNVCYTNIVSYDSLEELRQLCHNRFSYYFDNDLSILSFLSYNNAYHIRELNSKIGRR